MPPKFKPSSESTEAQHQAVQALRYIRQAAVLLEKELEGNSVPTWVEDGIAQAATSLGTALAYLRKKQE